MRRREFIAGLGSAAAWPLVARAQQGDRLRRIGVLIPIGGENDPEYRRRLSALTQALADLGWTDGRNVRIDLRGGGGDPNRIRALAQELVSLQPDMIVTFGSWPTLTVQRETPTRSLAPGPAVGSPISAGDHGCGGGSSSRASGVRRRGRWWRGHVSGLLPGRACP